MHITDILNQYPAATKMIQLCERLGIGDLRTLSRCDPERLIQHRHIGTGCVRRLRSVLQDHGLDFATQEKMND